MDSGPRGQEKGAQPPVVVVVDASRAYLKVERLKRKQWKAQKDSLINQLVQVLVVVFVVLWVLGAVSWFRKSGIAEEAVRDARRMAAERAAGH